MGQLFALNDDLAFPDIDYALEEPNGLLAVGGDLSTNRLIAAYKHGIFPWYQDNQPILWWSPNPRCVIDPSTFKASKTLAKKIARGEFDIGIDQNFTNVIAACSQRDQNEATWITRDMQDAYIKLYEKGVAHSIECYKDGELVGGLYGLSIGSLFFGESMFHRVTDASKVAFAQLMRLMRMARFSNGRLPTKQPHLCHLVPSKFLVPVSRLFYDSTSMIPQ